MRRTVVVAMLVLLLASLTAGCELFREFERIVGEWQLVSENGAAPTLVTDMRFTDDAYTGSTAGVETHTGTWTKSGFTYTLTGTLFGFAESGSFTPTFTNSNNTLTYSTESGGVYIYNRR
jgi:hypothetical protein